MREEMSYTDQTLYCRDCNEAFTFTVGEQEFFASRGLTNTPARCPACRAARKSQRNEQGNNGGSYSGNQGGQRQMYNIVCATCGNEAQVPFMPSEDRPVYCSDCFQLQNSGRRNDRRSRW
jgi:CxxC-x17-CxxC domain-containing protein